MEIGIVSAFEAAITALCADQRRISHGRIHCDGSDAGALAVGCGQGSETHWIGCEGLVRSGCGADRVAGGFDVNGLVDDEGHAAAQRDGEKVGENFVAFDIEMRRRVRAGEVTGERGYGVVAVEYGDREGGADR